MQEKKIKDDTISRQAALDALDEWESSRSWDAWCYEHKDEAKKFHIDAPTAVVENLPSAQPERKKGTWININESEKWECSECGRMMWFSPRLDVKPSDYKFCPNCGTDMRGEQNAAD